MVDSFSSRGWLVCVITSLIGLSGCFGPSENEKPAPTAPPVSTGTETETPTPEPEPEVVGTASPEDVTAARAMIDGLGSRSTSAPKSGNLLKEVVIRDGANLKPEDLELLGQLTDLTTLQIYDCRVLNDELAAKLSGLKGLTSLALTNTIISDATAEMIVASYPNLKELDLSSNTNMTNGVVKILSARTSLERLTLLQNKINDIGAQRLALLEELRTLDLRGNMEAGNMALEVVADLPKLVAFKHRSTAVTDFGMEYLARNPSLQSLLIQDFAITDQSGPYLAQLANLSQLELFRCQGFGTEGVLALKGMALTRLTLRDLPNVDDRAMEVFDDLPKLQRLYLHELGSVSDLGLEHLKSLKTLSQLDIWAVPQMTDSTVEVIATLPNLKELSIRATDVTDACIDTLLGMPELQSLTFKENGLITSEALEKLKTKKWAKLDLGS